MPALNLLSPTEKTAASLLWKYLIIKNVILIILTLSFVISLVLFGAKLVLLQKLTEVQAQTEIINITQAKINEKIIFYNNKIKAISRIQSEFIPWSEVLYKFNSLVTAGIHLQRAEFNSSENKIVIVGLAATRDDLLAFQDALHNCPLIKNVNLPLNTLLKKQNVNFNLSADLEINESNLINCQTE